MIDYFMSEGIDKIVLTLRDKFSGLITGPKIARSTQRKLNEAS